MKIAFLILAHKNPIQLAQLVKSLKHEETGVFIHIDKKSSLEKFTDYLESANIIPNYITSEVDIIYSSIRYIDATLILIKKAQNEDFDYFVLLSGLDLPLKPIDEIVDFFKENKNSSFMDYHEIPYNKLGYDGATRVNYYNFRMRRRMETLFPPKEIRHNISTKGRILNTILLFRNFFRQKRQFPMEMIPYYSSQWWNINKEGMLFITSFLEKNKKYYSYHKRALHPEEMFFQSILLNSHLKHKVINDNLRYIRWKEREKHPELIDIEELENIVQSTSKLFARKFDLKH